MTAEFVLRNDSQDLVTSEQTNLSKGDVLKNLLFRLLLLLAFCFFFVVVLFFVFFFTVLQLVFCNAIACTLNKIEVSCIRVSLNR